MEQKTSVWKDNLNSGLILSAALTAYTLILYIAGLSFEQWASWVVYLILFGVLFWGTGQYRDKQLGGFISYGKSWQVGTVMSIYASVISAIFTALLYMVIDPDLINQMLETVENKLLENPQMTEEAIDMAMKMTKKMYAPEYMPLYALFGTIVTGMIVSLLTSIFTQKKQNPTL